MEKIHNISFEEFYKSMGLEEYPFGEKTAEKEDTGKLFIEPTGYSALEMSFVKGQTIIVNGNRGTGKTIIEDDLKRKTGNKLVASITSFERVSLSDNIKDFYSLILQELTKALLIYLSKNKKVLRKMKHEQKVFVSFLIKKYGDAIADSELKKQIEDIQLSLWQRIVNYIAHPLTQVLNYGATAATNFGNEFLNSRFGKVFPDVNTAEIRKIFPEIKFEIVNDFKELEISYSLLNSSLEQIRTITGQKPIVFMDRFDEDSRIENDSEVLSVFIKELLSDNNFLLNDNIQLIIAVWKIAFEQLSTVFRKSKHSVYEIKWNRDYLLEVLDKRIQTYSNNADLSWKDIIDSEDTMNKVISLANSNPRDLWDVMDCILNIQYDLDADSRVITKEAVKQGMDKFVREFNFYEYYPKKKKARKDTTDVYTYIKQLSTLDSSEFTNAELRDKANTGGSTTNYITQMMRIGLISKTSTKRPGGSVIYRIEDPKVVYATVNNINIEH